ncbi:alpha-L-rhamnosidase [Izhakiella capsodis]|uniref:Alpha-L-rhamnosidase n=1 Tax=Izhakiella capsodis TaxID=1367852 RepID=A0A1I4XH12_9GAMM|nr:sugar hydrolase [Izhakiella capsodis]SFN24846.1 alpha-L-rhamnosidase [Izhakiella capsodis]
MNRRQLLVGFAALSTSAKLIPAIAAPRLPSQISPLSRPDGMDEQSWQWLKKAQALTPALHHHLQPMTGSVTMKANADGRYGYKVQKDLTPQQVAQTVLQSGDSIILDFGNHYTGYLSFDLGWQGKSADAPARLHLTFGEIPDDVAEPLYPYNGWISPSWLPDEVVNVDFLPTQFRVPRRHAFRFVKIEVIATSNNFGILLKQASVDGVSSAGPDSLKPQQYPSAEWERLDAVSMRTLSECMQTTFEDGPRRDQRLWLGDLYLQAMTNHVSFRHHDLVKRCLYLFAALRDPRGYVSACVYEKPVPRIGEAFLLDYALLFGVTLHDYVFTNRDYALLVELFPVAEQQLQLALRQVDSAGLFHLPADIKYFIDWKKELDKTAAMHGVVMFSLSRMSRMARALNQPEKSERWETLRATMADAARQHFWDENQEYFVSGADKQISWASQAWLGLAGIVPAAKAKNALMRVMKEPGAIGPTTPYLYHYMVDALVHNDGVTEAKQLILDYWGEMLNLGADTFWECFNPREPGISPYGGKQINSYCHAWSCTPGYFIRTNFKPTL